ncbi:MAG: PAS domain S-box protein [Flavipsychrobacter sp.]|nr:PAS domain S-box protein [Flavipsychrobacter sp.]
MVSREENIQTEDYKHFFDDLPVPMIIYDSTSLEILAVNRVATIKYGYSEKEFLSKNVLDLRPDEDGELYKKKITEIEDQGYADAGEWLHKKKDGTVFYVHIFSSATFFKDKRARLSLAYDINQRVLIEKENQALNDIVRDQKKQLDDILSSMKEVVWSRRISDGKLTYINDASIDVFGYTPEEMTAGNGRHLEHVHPDDRAELEEKIRQNYNEGHSDMEYRIFHKNGALKYVHTHAHVRKNEKGEPISYHGITIDFTNLRQTELALKKKILEIENVFESITDCFISIDKEWNVTYVNRHFEAMLHVSREEVLGKNFWASFPKVAASPYYQDYIKAMNDREVVHSERISPTTGKILSVYFYPTDTGVAVYFKDISDEINLNEKIANKEKKLSAVINNTKDIIWSFDTHMNLLSANDAYYARVALLTGNKRYEELNEYDFDQERLKKWNNYFKRVLSGETYRVIEEDEVEGKTIYEEISFNPIFDVNNNIAGASCFSRNITDRVEHLLMIQEQNEKLKNIAWIQSHKVRGPVATILGLVELLNTNGSEDINNKEILEGIKNSTLQLDSVIREVVNNTIIDND